MLKQETINAIINYLATKPFNEVAPLFEMIKKNIEESQDYNADTATYKEEEIKGNAN